MVRPARWVRCQRCGLPAGRAPTPARSSWLLNGALPSRERQNFSAITHPDCATAVAFSRAPMADLGMQPRTGQ